MIANRWRFKGVDGDFKDVEGDFKGEDNVTSV